MLHNSRRAPRTLPERFVSLPVVFKILCLSLIDIRDTLSSIDGFPYSVIENEKVEHVDVTGKQE